jgi:DNA-binding response OmpR family regulator
MSQDSHNYSGDKSGRRERILIVEDERPMRVALQDALAAEGYRVLIAENGSAGLEKALAEKPALILLDVMMPQLDGFAVCKELRRLEVRTPILFLTAKGLVQDRVSGLDAGADDYLVKPFSTEELLARVRALLRRSRDQSARATAQRIRIGETLIDLPRQIITRNGKQLHTTNKEFAMLRLLIENAGEPISRERFLDVVWGYTAFPTTRTVDTHIASLRAKIEPNPEQPEIIITVHGIGYRFQMPKPFTVAPTFP